MRKLVFALLSGLALSTAVEAANAQSGFALKGHYIVNTSTAEIAEEERQIPEADGFGIGAELVLPFGLGIGVSGFAADETISGDVETAELTVLGEANYFLRLGSIPIRPYVGIHAGLGRLSRDDPPSGLEIADKTRTQFGVQVGGRLQLTSLIGIDAQWRRMSTSAEETQDESFEREQVLIGVTLF